MMEFVYNEKNDCCGCRACEQVCPTGAIAMISDSEGFLYPEIDREKCIDCKKCQRVCAFANGTEIENRIEPAVYSVKASDEIRSVSTSGGMFTLLSDVVLNQGGVVYGVAFDENFKPAHIRAQDAQMRNMCRGSKYSQSDVKNTFSDVKADLERGLQVMFTGTPCQCAALDKFLGKTDKTNLLNVDVVCHGTPSPKLFGEYIQFVKVVRGKDIASYYHRAKKAGGGSCAAIEYADGTVEKGSLLAESWNNVFYTLNALRPSCYNCKYTKTQRSSDITIADFWGIEDCDAQFDDGKGVSLVIVNTQKGAAAFDNISHQIVFNKRSMSEATPKNQNLVKPTRLPDTRDQFWTDYENGGIKTVIKTYGQYNTVRMLKNFVKKILGRK